MILLRTRCRFLFALVLALALLAGTFATGYGAPGSTDLNPQSLINLPIQIPPPTAKMPTSSPSATKHIDPLTDFKASSPAAPPPAPPAPAPLPKEGWTSFSHWQRNADGTVTTKLFQTPEYRKNGSSWTQIDSSVTSSANSALPLAAAGSLRPVSFGSNGARLVVLGLDQGPVTLSSSDFGLATPIRQPDGSVMYPAVAPDTDVVYKVSGTGLKEELVLKSANSPRTFHFHVSDPKGQLGALTAQKSGAQRFASKIDDVPVELAPAFAFQPASEPTIPTPHDPKSAHLSVSAAGDGYDLTVSVDSAWLVGKSFPIVLDPSVNWSGNSTNEGYNNCDNLNGFSCPGNGGGRYSINNADIYDFAGTYTNPNSNPPVSAQPARSWFQFDFSSIPAGSTITSAQFNIFLHACLGGSVLGPPNQPQDYCLNHTNTIELHRMNAPWATYYTFNQASSPIDTGPPSTAITCRSRPAARFRATSTSGTRMAASVIRSSGGWTGPTPTTVSP